MNTRKSIDHAIAAFVERRAGSGAKPSRTVETTPPLSDAAPSPGSQHDLERAVTAWNRWIEDNGIPLENLRAW